MKKIKLMIFLAIIFVCFHCICYAQTSKTTVNIALLHTFSKPDPLCYDPFGFHLQHGVELAWNIFSKNNPNLSFDIVFNKYDLADNKLNSIDQVSKANIDGNLAAIGLVCSDFAILGGKQAQQDKLPLITPTATDDNISDIGPYVYMANIKNSYQGSVIAKFAYLTLKKRKALVISAVDCSYCMSLTNAFKSAFISMGGQIVDTKNILLNDSSFSFLQSKNSKEYDCVFLPNYTMQNSAIVSYFIKNGIKTIFLGGDAWVWSDKSNSIIGNNNYTAYAITGWTAKYKNKKSVNFVHSFNDVFSHEPLDTAAHSYDAAMMLFEALKSIKGQITRNSILQSLNKIKQFDGVTGHYQFKDNYPERTIFIQKLTKNDNQIVEIINPE